MNAWIQPVVFLLVLSALAVPLGAWMARVLERKSSRFESIVWRLCGVDPHQEMTAAQYSKAVLAFSALSTAVVYVMLRAVDGMAPAVAFNTAVSFATNTNWQAYSGESLHNSTQMLGLAVQNFVSASAGVAVLLALVRGFTRKETQTIGNFWVDLVRSTLYVLLPLSAALAIALASQGVPQTFAARGERDIQVGPVASQVAIKQLGTNGGGFYNANSAHPLENPTPASNMLELLAILLIPAALCFTFGRLVSDRRQGVALFAAMFVIFVPLFFAEVALETGNMEGKEVRFGTVGSAMWAVATTAASNGSVNAMHDSFTPLGGMIPMWLMQLGEVIFGGVGSGLYGMLMYAIIAVFIAGLMVGRTPEYLGKKIEAFEMKMASLAVLLPAAAVLVGTALACLIKEGTASVANPGAHGFSEILYAFSSGSNNNGSAFAGLTVSGPFYATAIGVAMWIGRFWVIIPVLAIAGALAKKKAIPAGAGTLPTHGVLFIVLLAGTVVLIGALTFIPALALGPIAEHLGGH